MHPPYRFPPVLSIPMPNPIGGGEHCDPRMFFLPIPPMPRKFNAQNLANTVWAFGKVGRTDDKLLAALARIGPAQRVKRKGTKAQKTNLKTITNIFFIIFWRVFTPWAGPRGQQSVGLASSMRSWANYYRILVDNTVNGTRKINRDEQLIKTLLFYVVFL